MSPWTWRRCVLPALLLALPLLAASATSDPAPEEVPMQRISGAFDVKMTPNPAADTADSGAKHYRLDKRYHGDLDATAVGVMTAHVTGVEGSAGYVAIERVTGTLAGRSGSFVLQHSGLMDHGAKELDIRVVPDSADGELGGLRGRMQIRIETGGAHFYDFEYRLPD